MAGFRKCQLASIPDEAPGPAGCQVSIFGKEEEVAFEIGFETCAAGKVGKEGKPFTALLAGFEMRDFGGRTLPAVAYKCPAPVGIQVLLGQWNLHLARFDSFHFPLLQVVHILTELERYS